MAPEKTCLRCGAPLGGDARQGFCPKCLFAQAQSLEIEEPSGESVPFDAPLAPGQPRLRYFGDYELLEEIGRGGMGAVFKARQLSLNRIVAVKMIAAGQLASADVVQRFHLEAEAAAGLDHPNIVPIYEIGDHDGQHFFSMRFIEGGSLAQRIANPEFQISLPQRAGLIATVARAVHYAHQHGILHRDLKPGNILLDGHGQPHVADFGLAKLLEHQADLTPIQAVMGTPSYMAPEQAEGRFKTLTTAADIYSLGAILYELLAGQPPFVAETSLKTMRKVVEEEPVPPSLVRKQGRDGTKPSRWQIDKDLETICLRCLNKDASSRYATAKMLADDLDRWRNREPILARPVSVPERLWRWCRRRPVIAGLAAALSAAFAVGLSGVFIEWQRAEQQQHLAQTKSEMLRTLRYADAMNLALRAGDEGNWRQAFYLLQQQFPNRQRDLRGFEWRRLWWRCRGDYKQILPRHNQVWAAWLFRPMTNSWPLSLGTTA